MSGQLPTVLVGSPEQSLNKIQRYIAMGIRAFIFSGYPHKSECELFVRYVLPSLKTCKLPRGSKDVFPPPHPQPR